MEQLLYIKQIKYLPQTRAINVTCYCSLYMLVIMCKATVPFFGDLT